MRHLKYSGVRIFFLVSLLFILFSLLVACTDNQQVGKPKSSENDKEKKKPHTSLMEEWKLPINIQEGNFYKVGGWLSDHELLYITNVEQSSSVYRYHLLKGKSSLLYKSEQPIVNVQFNPSKKYLLIQSSPSSYEGEITIIDENGTKIVTKTIASYELEFEWNPYNDSEVLISAFKEDWTYQMFLIDVKATEITEIALPQPFIKWVGKEEVSYLGWDDNNLSLTAPVMIRNIRSQDEFEAFPAVFQMAAFRNVFMTVAINDQDQSQSTYSFFDHDRNKITSISMPHLTLFSDWLVPFYDYHERKGQFITLRPHESMEADSYSRGFELIAFDLKKGSNELILDGLENAPIQYAPSGETVLYGNYFEKLIDLKSKKVYELVIEK